MLIDIVKAGWLMGKYSLYFLFNLYPENVLKEFRIDIICGIPDSGLCTYRSRSSAYNKTLCSIPHLWIPRNLVSDFSAIESGSMAIANKSGETALACATFERE